METIRYSVRYPPETAARLQYHRKGTGVVANSFVVQATERALDEIGVPRDVPIPSPRPKRRKAKRTA